jgi:hypothetical protein
VPRLLGAVADTVRVALAGRESQLERLGREEPRARGPGQRVDEEVQRIDQPVVRPSGIPVEAPVTAATTAAISGATPNAAGHVGASMTPSRS